MKQILITIFFSIAVLIAFAQKEIPNKTQSENISAQKNDAAIYQLFPTQHFYIFIKLNTRTGQMWMVQYDVDGSNRLEVLLSVKFLVAKEDEANGRFTLYPTKNYYTFILLDQLDGRTWQVQWSTEAEKRFTIPITI